MQGKWKKRIEAGSCNFCTDRMHRKVFEFMRDEGGGTMVRICRQCLRELKQLTRSAR